MGDVGLTSFYNASITIYSTVSKLGAKEHCIYYNIYVCVCVYV
jgi:hypothetical protein